MRLLLKSHKRFPLVVLSILPHRTGNRHPGTRSQRDDLKPKPSPSKAPKMLHFRAPQLSVQNQTPGSPPPPAPGSLAAPAAPQAEVRQPPRSAAASRRERVRHRAVDLG